MRFKLGRPSPALVIACISLFVALGGVGYAAATGSIDGREIKNNSVATGDLKNNSIVGKDVKTSGLTGGDVKANTLTGSDIAESGLGKVPSAGKADSAATAGSANTAGSGRIGRRADAPQGELQAATTTRRPLPIASLRRLDDQCSVRVLRDDLTVNAKTRRRTIRASTPTLIDTDVNDTVVRQRLESEGFDVVDPRSTCSPAATATPTFVRFTYARGADGTDGDRSAWPWTTWSDARLCLVVGTLIGG